MERTMVTIDAPLSGGLKSQCMYTLSLLYAVLYHCSSR